MRALLKKFQPHFLALKVRKIASPRPERPIRLERLEDRSMLDGDPTLTLGPAGAVYEGQWFTISGSLSPPGTYSTSGTLHWEGGSPGFTGPIGFTTAEDGSFSFTAMAYDDGPSPGNGTLSDQETLRLDLMVDNQSLVSATTTATVLNTPPEVDAVQFFGSPYSTGPMWTLFATLNDAGTDRMTVTIDWGDETFTILENQLPGAFLWIDHTYYTNTTENYDVQLTVSDDDTAEVEISLTAAVDPPITYLGDYIWGWEAQDLNYFINAESDFGGIAEYQLDIDNDGVFDMSDWSHQMDIDGVLAFNVPLLHLLGTPADDAAYPANLRIVTDWGYYQDYDVEITVGNMPPEIFFGGDEDGQPGVPFELVVTTDDPGPDTVTQITVDWGDGSSSVIQGEGGTVTHVYANDGRYQIRATALDEDGSYWKVLHTNIGITDPPPEPTDEPVITSAIAIILENEQAALTVEAVDSYGSPNVTFEWDLDGDGTFELSGPATVLLTPGNGFYPYTATVRVTDALGRATEGLFAFLQGGVQIARITKFNYRTSFLKVTPTMPGVWQVHHTKQQRFAARYLHEKGINVHDLEHLRGIDPTLHAEITKAQDEWWKLQERAGYTVANIPLAKVEEFEAKLAAEFGSRWVAAGTSSRGIDRVRNFVADTATEFGLQKAARWGRLGLPVELAMPISKIMRDNAEALIKMAQFDPATHGEFKDFMAQYEKALEENISRGYVSKQTGETLTREFCEFARSMALDEAAIGKINVALQVWSSQLPD